MVMVYIDFGVGFLGKEFPRHGTHALLIHVVAMEIRRVWQVDFSVNYL